VTPVAATSMDVVAFASTITPAAGVPSTFKTRTGISITPNSSSKVAKNAFPWMSRAAIVKNTKSSINPGIVMLDVVEVPRTGKKFARTV
jgi:hypothetical protein